MNYPQGLLIVELVEEFGLLPRAPSGSVRRVRNVGRK